jgi:polyribonucleotide nucleotidyltransferase
VGSYQLDETVEGTVRRVTNFGAFVDIGSEVDAFVLTSFISAGDYDTARCVNEVYQLFLSFQYIVLTLRTKCLSLLYTQRVGWLEFVRVLALAACALVVMCSGERP